MSGRTLQIQATKPQAEFLTLKAKYRLFCAGFGSGKSETMASAALIDASQSASILVGLYAPTFDLVRLITAPRIQLKLAEHGVVHRYNKNDNAIYTSSPGFGDFIMRTLDNPERIVGYETYTAHADELDTLKTEHARKAWNQIIARNRQRPKGLTEPFNQASAYTTPEGFKFCHDRWVANRGPSYALVQASTYSNPYLPKDYIESLRESYPAELIDAYIEGKFVNLTTGTVYSAYDRERCRSHETIKQGEPLFIGQDFNVGAMASTIYVRRPNGWHAVDQLTGIYDTPSLITTIDDRYVGHQITIYPDASGKSRKTVNASTSDIALLQQAGYRVKAPNANPPVKDRIMAVNGALSRGDLWVNDRKCPDVAACLEQQAYDKNGEPDKQGGFDHQNDATGYMPAFEMPIRKPVASVGPIRFM
ncbi:terminase [Vreelandella andesensis]|uniref:Terminase n=1 Tax=Vreelandella andesensis TaxID=447567 RepID=A0A3S0VYU6_9GAMM|nr:terminase family protein [Halomonas andesensis]RUR26834.1 terminase [Halomonas andesensis]